VSRRVLNLGASKAQRRCGGGVAESKVGWVIGKLRLKVLGGQSLTNRLNYRVKIVRMDELSGFRILIVVWSDYCEYWYPFTIKSNIIHLQNMYVSVIRPNLRGKLLIAFIYGNCRAIALISFIASLISLIAAISGPLLSSFRFSF
jgi:hypothetical protein